MITEILNERYPDFDTTPYRDLLEEFENPRVPNTTFDVSAYLYDLGPFLDIMDGSLYLAVDQHFITLEMAVLAFLQSELPKGTASIYDLFPENQHGYVRVILDDFDDLEAYAVQQAFSHLDPENDPLIGEDIFFNKLHVVNRYNNTYLESLA